jgi:hypothetical protein
MREKIARRQIDDHATKIVQLAIGEHFLMHDLEEGVVNIGGGDEAGAVAVTSWFEGEISK